jgi:pimeloyl-ACP methyl ester carboxylesterase
MRGVDKVIAIGTSVGGASVIQAGAQCPTMIDGIIAENPVAEPRTPIVFAVCLVVDFFCFVEQFAVEHLRKMIGSYGLPRVVSLLLMPFYRIVVGVFLLRIGAFFNYRSPLMVVRLEAI